MAIEPAYYRSLRTEMTEEIGERLGRCLRPGDVVALFGDVGAGKTAFIRGIARGMGISKPVTSPTYTIVNEYDGPVPLFHFDMYRLRSAQEVLTSAGRTSSAGGRVAVEWSSIPACLENGYIRV